MKKKKERIVFGSEALGKKIVLVVENRKKSGISSYLQRLGLIKKEKKIEIPELTMGQIAKVLYELERNGFDYENFRKNLQVGLPILNIGLTDNAICRVISAACENTSFQVKKSMVDFIDKNFSPAEKLAALKIVIHQINLEAMAEACGKLSNPFLRMI